MQITHPKEGFQGISAENLFLALDEMGTQVGWGSIVYQYLPNRCPDVPINMYFTIDSQPNGWYMLYGALLARARQLRESNPGVPARFYTKVAPEEQALLNLYQHNEMNCQQVESHVRLFKPDGDGRIPMACTVAPTSLNTQEEMSQLLERLYQNEIFHIDLPYLQWLSNTPHFHVLAMIHGNVRVGEVVVSGTGNHCELNAIYTVPMYRRQGMAKMLLHRCMAVMSTEGVEDFTATFISLSEPQKHLAMDFHAVDLQLLNRFPEILL